MKRVFGRLSIFLVVCVLSCLCLPCIAFATGDIDGLTDGQTTQQSTQANNGDENTANAGNGALGDYLGGYSPVNGDNVASASEIASPIVDIIGNLVGVIALIASAGIFLVTALDLCYIGLPFTRGLLTMRWQLQTLLRIYLDSLGI